MCMCVRVYLCVCMCVRVNVCPWPAAQGRGNEAELNLPYTCLPPSLFLTLLHPPFSLLPSLFSRIPFPLSPVYLTSSFELSSPRLLPSLSLSLQSLSPPSPYSLLLPLPSLSSALPSPPLSPTAPNRTTKSHEHACVAACRRERSPSVRAPRHLGTEVDYAPACVGIHTSINRRV